MRLTRRRHSRCACRRETWTPLAWDTSANRYAIDVWQDIAVHQRDAVDCDAGRPREPRRQLVVQSRHVSCPGRPRTSRRRDERRPTFESMAALPTCATTARARITSRSTDRRPGRRFAWTAIRSPSRRSTSTPGTGRGASPNEPAPARDGSPAHGRESRSRSSTDGSTSTRSIRWRSSKGLLHVATNTRGWFALPVDSAALERLSRPLTRPFLHWTSRSSTGNRDSDEPELCLQGVDGQFARLSPNGATRRTQGCPVFSRAYGILALHARRLDASACFRLQAPRVPASAGSSMDGSPTK